MNDEWSRCPVCFEDYSLVHRPTTFICGHSMCIDHTVGNHRLRECPICRQQFRQNVFHVAYDLEEASRLFQLIKTQFDLSNIKLAPVSEADLVQTSEQEMIHNDEIMARRLHAELNRQIPSRTQRTVSPIRQRPTHIAVPSTNSVNNHLKGCRHRCDLVSTRQCCICSDRRPYIPGAHYEKYVDGQGIVHGAARNEYYCSSCKKR